MKSILKIAGFVLSFIVLVSCDNSASLQKYFIDSKENEQFISVDLPASILQLKNENASEEIKNTFETIKNVNFLALQLTDSNADFYTSEKEKVKQILKNSTYKELMRMNLGKASVSVNYLGEEDAIDEIIVFGSENEKGFAIARLVGDNMNPHKIMELIQEIKMNDDSNEMKQLEGLMSLLQ
ncbi:DUF4252 domain-containing protein [Lutibacter sp. HS1-25]|uniref:DUF4252 domain-containing protein n=1 Tax=Lutibacter sp. HS1-25 TaxID=2485000 RepID=UPI0010106542|nr:DUF4252 domain-containing protein [Lutibacter sp. HS1-25]RXP61872.1 DUF4252 domain-containing protein [Lutibacter sp. HS1-25]